MIELTEERKNELKRDMIKVIKTNGRYYDIDERSLDKMIDLWCDNKANIYNCFKKQKSWNEDELCLVIKDKVFRNPNAKGARSILYKIFDTIVPSSWDYNRMAEFILCEGSSTLYYAPKYSEENITVTEAYILEGNTNFEILYSHLYYKCHLSMGMKKSRAICKMIDYVANYFNREYKALTYELDEQCKIRNEDGGFTYTYSHNWEQTKAKLCDYLTPLTLDETFYISINPLDYLTMSHGEGWSSCHSIRDDGCYHSATVTTLTDPSTIIVYTLSDKNKVEKNFWSINKLTRQMIFLSNDLDGIFQQVFYPSRSTNDADIVRNVLQQILSSYIMKPNLWESVSYRDVSIDTDEYLGYDDWCQGKTSICSKIKGSNPEFTIGFRTPCIDDVYSSVYENGYFSSEDDEGYVICACCGERIWEEDAYYYEGEYYCDDCFNENFYRCEHCSDIIPQDDVIIIDDEAYCPHCAERMDYKDTKDGYCTEDYLTLYDGNDEYYYYKEENLMSDHPDAKRCDICGDYFIGEECEKCKVIKEQKEKAEIIVGKVEELTEESEYFEYKEEFIRILRDIENYKDLAEIIMNTEVKNDD